VVGQVINGIFPIGSSFSIPDKSDRLLLVGGGSGVAPMLFLSKICGLSPSNISILIGAKSINDHIDISSYRQYAKFYFTTEDGSFGEMGYVTNHSVFQDQLTDFSKIYACGPDQMMKAVARKAQENNIFCEVSLENMMACGFGVCLCCVEDTKYGHKCVCTDGPVFNINELKW
jgi:dihydroorotate dehydrogenase electron transfer subunit